MLSASLTKLVQQENESKEQFLNRKQQAMEEFEAKLLLKAEEYNEIVSKNQSNNQIKQEILTESQIQISSNLLQQQQIQAVALMRKQEIVDLRNAVITIDKEDATKCKTFLTGLNFLKSKVPEMTDTIIKIWRIDVALVNQELNGLSFDIDIKRFHLTSFKIAW